MIEFASGDPDINGKKLILLNYLALNNLGAKMLEELILQKTDIGDKIKMRETQVVQLCSARRAIEELL